jgi:hypothetical protein
MLVILIGFWAGHEHALNNLYQRIAETEQALYQFRPPSGAYFVSLVRSIGFVSVCSKQKD